MTLAMTSIAVTASICANASEAARLVASFMQISLDSGVTRRCAECASHGQISYSEHPATSNRLDASPLSEYRPSQIRVAIRRQFGSGAAELCATDGIFE